MFTSNRRPKPAPVICLILLCALALLHADTPDLVVLDEDWNVPGDAICEANIPLLLTSPRVRLLALTGVTGDAWCNEGVANVLKFLEEIGHPEIPVARGATFPLLNTSARLALWEKQFGPLSWRGAWNTPATEAGHPHPDTPFAIRYPCEGPPAHQPLGESAPALMIDLVHRYPHQVTFISGGPLTNFALAVRLDPQFASLAKRLIFGLSVRDTLAGRPVAHRPEFNIVFDAEAAHIVLTADWNELVLLDPVVPDPPLTKELVASIQQHPTAASNYLVENGKLGLPLWAKHVAIVADPALVLKEVQVRSPLDVDLDLHHATYASALVVPAENYAGPAGGQHLTVVTAIDMNRCTDDYEKALQSPLCQPKPPVVRAGMYEPPQP